MRAIRIQCFQNLANYRKPSSLIIKETYPLPPYSTVIGMVHRACDFKEYHPMNVSIQGTNKGTISDLYTRYSFSFGTIYFNATLGLTCAFLGNLFRGWNRLISPSGL